MQQSTEIEIDLKLANFYVFKLPPCANKKNLEPNITKLNAQFVLLHYRTILFALSCILVDWPRYFNKRYTLLRECQHPWKRWKNIAWFPHSISNGAIGVWSSTMNTKARNVRIRSRSIQIVEIVAWTRALNNYVPKSMLFSIGTEQIVNKISISRRYQEIFTTE